MLDMLYILLAGVIVATIGLPIVTVLDKWKKEMQEADKKGGEED